MLFRSQDREIVESKGRNAIGVNCPNCGAPITSLGAKKCEYCESPIIELNIKAWIFTNVQERL